FRLTSQHLKELVAQRLIRHKSKDATNIIRQIYSQLRNAFKRIEISEELFIQIYPVHPETLELLDKNSDLFSQRRGIVDFIASQIKGRRDENIQGILAKPADSLLTADKIFDHFSDRLATSLEYSKYYRIYKEHFEMRIAVDFPDHDDQVLAQRIVKLLILLEITPFEEIRTTRDLANMLLHKTLISDIPAADINYEHIHTNILTVLMKKTGFLKCLPGKTYLENVYRLDLKSDPSQTSDNRIKRMIQDLSPMAKEVTDSVYTTMASGLFPLALFYNRVQKREAIRWENTFRTLAVILCDFTSLEKNLLNNLRNEVLTGKIDFILLLGRYGNTEAQLLSAQQFLTREATETSTAWGFLIPTIIDDSRSLNAFLEVFACKKIIEELGNDISEQAVQTLMIIKETLNKATQNAHRIMSEGYQNGILYVSSGRYQLQGIVRITHFDQWLSSIIQTPLQLRYPEHDTVAPRMEIGSRIVPDLLLEHFITPGFLSDFKPGRDEVLQNGLNLIALPLGLARKEGTRYILTVTPRKCPAAKQIMKYIPSETVDEHLFDVPKIELESLRVKLATSKSGMSQPVFELTLAALTRKGYVSLYSKDQPLAFEHLRYPLATHLDRVSRGPLLPAKFRPAFAALYKLFSKKHLKEFDLDIQNGFWQKLLITFSKWKQELESVREMLNSMSSLYPEDQKNMVPMHEILDRFTQVCELVEQDQTACAGLQNLISHYLTSPDFENGITQIRKLISFTQVNQYPYLKARHFLNDHRLSVPSLDSYQKLNYLFENAFELQHFNYEMVFSGKLKDFLSAFQAFHSAYLQQYNSEHNAWKEQILKYDPQIVLQSSEFRVLEKLAKIRTLNFSSVVDEIKQNLYNIDQMKCTKDASILLESVPVCTCNYHLGFSPNLPQPSEIIEQAGKCIQGFLEILHTSTVSSPLDKAAEQCDKQTRNSLQSLLQLHQNQPELALMLSSLLTDNLVAFFDANMFKDQEIHHLNISMLLNVLRGQKLTAEQARIRFEEWLQGDGNIKDDDLLNIE
ncbi:hypothetical protein JW979_16000, partial [bacterium]|nr:hypothetical protein [candidate division CSSED10-310 bacterium]